MRRPRKEYAELTSSEIDEIIRRGGDAKEWLNNAVYAHLDTLELSQHARDIINSTDPVCEFFAGLHTAGDVEEYIRENYPEEE